MRALVVYESSFGNTGEIARAVWEGMFSRLPDVALMTTLRVVGLNEAIESIAGHRE